MVTGILFGLIPALMWGIQPIVMTKIGGRSSLKLMGMALGIFLASLGIFFFRGPGPLDPRLILLSFLDGIALSYGLVHQIRGLEILGISKGSPISTGGQLIGASLVAALYFKEWSSRDQYILGSLALISIILGVALTAYKEEKEAQDQAELLGGLVHLGLSSLGFVLYTVILRLGQISIWEAILPQGLGMLVASYFFSRREDRGRLLTPISLRHIATGFIFSLGNISLMLSNEINGLSVGFTLTQMSVVVASLGGLVFLGEEKTRKELVLTLLGLVLVVAGGVLIGLTKK